MKRILLIFLSLFISYVSSFEVVKRLIKVPIDHFSLEKRENINLIYYYNDTFYRHGGPIFLHISNGKVNFNESAVLWDWAPEFGAALIFTERRIGRKGDNPPYQALADFAMLIKEVKSKQPFTECDEATIITFGSAYGANLAYWLRAKYPHFVTGAVASSPIFAGNKSSCAIAETIIRSNLNEYGHAECSDSLRASLKAIGDTIDEDGEILNSTLNVCDNSPLTKLTGNIYKNVILKVLIQYIYNIVKYNYPYQTEMFPAHPVRKFCESINQTDGPEIILANQIFEGMNAVMNSRNESQCFFNETIDVCDIQLCKSDQSLFPQISETATCVSTRELNQRYEQFHFGGMKISSSNVIFSFGERDPNTAFAHPQLPKNLREVYQLSIKNASHSYDLRKASKYDTESVKAIRELEKIIIRRWINNDEKSDCKLVQSKISAIQAINNNSLMWKISIILLFTILLHCLI